MVANWNALKTKVAADMDAWNAKIAQLKHDRGIKRADNHAERLEWEASFAVDYAVAAIEEAKWPFSMPLSAASRRKRPGDPELPASKFMRTQDALKASPQFEYAQ